MTGTYTIERLPFDEDHYERHQREIVSYRVEVLTNGAEFLVVAQDPHGFFQFRPIKGALPDRLNGEYTNMRAVRKAIESYISSNPKQYKKSKPAEDSALPST